MTAIQWEPWDDPSFFLTFTPRRVDGRELPVDPESIDRAAFALARRPGVLGVLVTLEDDGRREVHAAFDIPNGHSERATRSVRRILRSLGLRANTFGSGPACWRSTEWVISFPPAWLGSDRPEMTR